MVNIPLNSPVDLETVDIIQSNEISFKKKNSLVYQGILSNFTKKNGDGQLSTTGKQITIENNILTADNTRFTLNPEAVITENDTVTDKSNIISARVANGNIYSIEKIDYNSLQLSIGDTTITVTDNNALDANGTITSDLHFIVVFYHTDSTIVRDYDTLDGFEGHIFSELFGQKSVSSYIENDDVWIGFDSEDLRKRYCLKNFEIAVTGMGLIADNGIITGEPFFWTRTKDDTELSSSSDISTYTTTGLSSISYKDNSDYFHQVILDNGVIQNERFNTHYATPHYRILASVSGSNVDPVFNYNEVTRDKSYCDELKEIGANPNTSYHSGSQSNNPITAGLMNYHPGRFIASSDEMTVSVIHLWCLAIEIVDSKLNAYVIPAMRRSPIGAFIPSGSYTTTKFYNERFSLEAGTEITFFDYDILPKIGEDDNGKQLFGNIRFFSNKVANKGRYWDYGKGWVHLIADTFHYRRYDSFGTTIFEEPLKLITVTKDGITIQETDIQPSSPKNMEITNGSLDYYSTEDSSIMTETEWYNSRFSVNMNILRWSPISGQLHTNVRLHPITDTYLEANQWYYNHSILDIMSLSFSAPIDDNYSVQVYNNIPVSLSYNKTLLFTPHTLGDNWSITDDYICEWSSNNISYARIQSDGDITLSKMTDYIFKLNIIGSKNVLVETRNGSFSLQRAFIPYIMDIFFNVTVAEYNMPNDSDSIVSNDVYNFAAGYNSGLKEDYIASSFLLPAFTLRTYLDTDQLSQFNEYVLNNKNGIIRADISRYFYDNEEVQEYWTHTQASTDVSYKNSLYLVNSVVTNSQNEDYIDTTWFPDSESIIYPIGILSKIYGENYITSTVDVGDNYTSRFYNKQNKTYLVYNNVNAVYFGSEIFTIQSGNYYFDGQGIYYLGSQSDYSQNVFTAYAIGMKFLANSSSEAFFYSAWDRSLYLYTASNTLQKSISLADKGNIIDSLYSSAEQALYILFDDGSLYIKTQDDMCIIENVNGNTLQSTSIGCQIIGDNSYEIYNPYIHDDTLPLYLETEWLGNVDTVTKYQYIDFVLYGGSDSDNTQTVELSVQTLDGTEIYEETKSITIDAWSNKLARIRYVPKRITGNAIKIILKSDYVKLFSVSVSAMESSTVTSAPRGNRM